MECMIHKKTTIPINMEDHKIVQIYNQLQLDGLQKVVQLCLEEQPFLLYGGSFHPEILERFLNEHRIGYTPIQAPHSEVPALVPPIRGDGYIVKGMGEASLYFAEKLYTGMSGKSKDYDMGIDWGEERLLRQSLIADGWTCI